MPPMLEEDAIIVTTETPFHTSPDSTISKIEPIDVNLLAQTDTLPPYRYLESPTEPFEEESPSRSNTAIPQLVFSSDPRSYSKKERARTGPTMEDRLLAMPEKRPLPWRNGVKAGAEVETGGDSRRKQIRFGCLLATRGEIAPIPCNSCAKGRGKFSVCVSLPGYFKNACASCQLSGRPQNCSIKHNDGGADEQSPSSKSYADKEAFNGLPPPPPRQPSPAFIQSAGPPAPKRRRIDEIPEWESVRSQWDQESTDRRSRPHPLAQNDWSNPTIPPINPHPKNPHSNEASTPIRFPPILRDPTGSIGWATVNQPTPKASPHIPSNGVEGGNNHDPRRDNEARRILENDPRKIVEQERREETAFNEEGSMAMIDKLPKPKQRQVYGIISGLQGGIEHLQRELDALKKALGIDDE